MVYDGTDDLIFALRRQNSGLVIKSDHNCLEFRGLNTHKKEQKVLCNNTATKATNLILERFTRTFLDLRKVLLKRSSIVTP